MEVKLLTIKPKRFGNSMFCRIATFLFLYEEIIEISIQLKLERNNSKLGKKCLCRYSSPKIPYLLHNMQL
jgi:hypothetical protein